MFPISRDGRNFLVTIMVTFFYIICLISVRIIARKTLIDFWKSNASSEQPLKAWYDVAKKANWNSHNFLKSQIPDASVINTKRVVFNIKGNSFRLIVDIEYSIRLIFIVWVGSHAEYDKINVKNLSYVKSNKNKKRS